MDPVSRRFMWSVISDLSRSMSIVLTTHSMEECEALCGRVGIMVNGRLACLGSLEHLKHKYGRGFQLEINTSEVSRGALGLATLGVLPVSAASATLVPVSDSNSLSYVAALTARACVSTAFASAAAQDRIEDVRTFVRDLFSGAEEQEYHAGRIKYLIPKQQDGLISADGLPLAGTSLAQIFAAIEARKVDLDIHDYGCGGASLEQIFVAIARGQDKKQAQEREDHNEKREAKSK
jgi:ATP-binding cassette subfamily A (ABC1) protein 3